MEQYVAKRWRWGFLVGVLVGLISLNLILAGCSDSLQLTPTPGQTALTSVPATITNAAGQSVPMTIELARTSKEQEVGLMNRTNVPDGIGMLFVFQQVGIVGFWMKDTRLALSIAFIDGSGKILDIQDMQAMSEETHAPSQPYLYALEVGQGWFTRQGIKPGDGISFKLPA